MTPKYDQADRLQPIAIGFYTDTPTTAVAFKRGRVLSSTTFSIPIRRRRRD
jgi:hypothetical protein